MKIKKYFRLPDPKNLAQIGDQIFLIAINLVLVILILNKPLNTFISTDPPPQIEVVSREKGHIGYPVEAGMHIENFHEFDLTKNKFVLNAIVWFKFNPAVLSLDTIEKFSFEKGDILSKSEPRTKLVGNKVLARYRIKFKFTSNLDYRAFPLNSHRLYITLTNKTVSPKEMLFQASESGFTLSKNILVPGWKKTKHRVITGYSESLLDRTDPTIKIQHPVLVFEIDFMRSGIRQLLVLFIPLFFMFYLTLFSLSLGATQYTSRIGVSLGNISAFIGYRFVVEGVSPKVGYSMFIDLVFHLLLFISFFVFFINLFTKNKEYARLRGTAILIIHTVFIASWYYLCRIWLFKS